MTIGGLAPPHVSVPAASQSEDSLTSGCPFRLTPLDCHPFTMRGIAEAECAVSSHIPMQLVSNRAQEALAPTGRLPLAHGPEDSCFVAQRTADHIWPALCLLEGSGTPLGIILAKQILSTCTDLPAPQDTRSFVMARPHLRVAGNLRLPPLALPPSDRAPR